MRTINDVLKSDVKGLFYGNRVLLPFSADIFKAIIENDIITNFSKNSKQAYYNKYPDFTEIYFLQYKDLEDFITKFEHIKIVVVENGEDIFNIKNHRKLTLHLEKDHQITIEELDGDIIFIE